MRYTTTMLVLTVLALGLLASPARAQVAWESPLMVPPAAPRGMGIYLTEGSHGGGLGVLGTYRAADAPAGLGFRLGLVDGPFDDLSVLGGVDFSGYLVRQNPDFPLDLVWNGGAGASVGDWALISFPLGMTFGRVLVADGVRFNPYLGPRLVLDARMGDNAPGDNLDLGLAVDLGVDISFDPTFAIRVAGSAGDRDALAVGVVFPGTVRR